MIRDLVHKNRSYRRFFEDVPIDMADLRDLIDLARLTPSAANKQALRYYLSTSSKMNKVIFPCLSWAGYLKDWTGPAEGERPSAYILLLEKEDHTMGLPYDAGIAAQTILLGAVEKGLGGCIIASIHRQKLRDALGLDPTMEILLAIALGKPKEKIVLDEVSADASIRYWRENDGTHHVPKLRLNDIIIGSTSLD